MKYVLRLACLYPLIIFISCNSSTNTSNENAITTTKYNAVANIELYDSSANEATDAAMLGASVHYPLRGAITFKSTVGTNVASDALSNLASGGVTGGVLVILGEDYGEGSSIIQERSHAFAMKSQMWLFDPRPNHASLVRSVEKAFELSEASRTPAMLTMRVRACHSHGRFITAENRRPPFTVKDALDDID